MTAQKKTPRKTLSVAPIEGERFVFNVESENGIEFYRVDLTAISLTVRAHGTTILNTFNGQCDCSHFQFRLLPLARHGFIARCKHILAVRDYFLDSIMNEYLKAEIEAVKRQERSA